MSEREPIEHEATHTTSLAVWDLTSPVVIGCRTTLKVGVACPAGCDLTGTWIDVYNETGARVGGGKLGSVPWPATTALYWAELDLAAPEVEGDQSWSFHATTPEPPHGQATSIVRFVASRPPEHRVTLEVIDKASGIPLTGVELRVGRFRAATNEAGIAYVEVPAGTCEVCAFKIGYDILSSTAHIIGDTTIRLEVAVAPEPVQPYWM